jgi:uncharacterized DUF497 family protein
MQIIIYTVGDMNFLFAPERWRINLRKHGLDLADAERVFAGEILRVVPHI